MAEDVTKTQISTVRASGYDKQMCRCSYAPIPRFAHAFMEKYRDRLLYGTDMGTFGDMYRATFRILETADEHFYQQNLFNYHWPLYGLALSDETLKKIYKGNAEKIMGGVR